MYVIIEKHKDIFCGKRQTLKGAQQWAAELKLAFPQASFSVRKPKTKEEKDHAKVWHPYRSLSQERRGLYPDPHHPK
jgi:hypothetical protein